MGSKQSGFLLRQEQETNFVANAYKDVMRQFMVDTLQITMNRFEGYGYKRIMRLTNEWEKVQKELEAAVDPSHPECDVKQEHMEKFFAEICKGHSRPIPFKDRYPRLKGVNYKPKRLR